jgi:hypothetical protein
VTQIAMESSGVYWKPVWNVVEREFAIVLANAQHIKNVPGRKTDQKDAEWIARIFTSLSCNACKVGKPYFGRSGMTDAITRYTHHPVNDLAITTIGFSFDELLLQ